MIGYIQNKTLTTKGEFAAAVYGYELPLTEIYSQNVLEQLNQVELGILATALVYEPRKADHAPRITRNVRTLKEITDETSKSIQRMEQRLHIWPKSKEYFYHLAGVTEAWLQGCDFSKLEQYSDVDEGELIRYFRMAVQVLREIRQAPVSSFVLKETIKKLLVVMNRDIIDAEKQLRLK